MSPLLEPAAVAVSLAANDGARVLAPLSLALLRLVSVEERREHQIAEEPHLGQLDCASSQRSRSSIGDALVRLADR